MFETSVQFEEMQEFVEASTVRIQSDEEVGCLFATAGHSLLDEGQSEEEKRKISEGLPFE